MKATALWSDFLVSSILAKNERKIFDFTTMELQVELFSFLFLGELKTQKKTFKGLGVFIQDWVHSYMIGCLYKGLGANAPD